MTVALHQFLQSSALRVCIRLCNGKERVLQKQLESKIASFKLKWLKLNDSCYAVQMALTAAVAQILKLSCIILPAAKLAGPKAPAQGMMM